MTVSSVLAFCAVLQIAAAIFLFSFWRWFEFWRRRRALTYAFAFLTVVVVGLPAYVWRRQVFAARIAFPVLVQVIGWAIIVVWSVLGTVADRQIGTRVRLFGPHFAAHGHIDLKTGGAYAIVRHPIYSAWIFFVLGTFLVTGYPVLLVSLLVITLGAFRFTKHEEERTKALLADPSEYDRYRERVPALLPSFRRRAGRAAEPSAPGAG